MNPELAFDSIESAHEFVALVSKVALETKHDIDADIQREVSSTASRRVEALQIVVHKLGALELHLTQIRRILNDLRPCVGCFSKNGALASRSFDQSQPEWRNLRLLRALRPRAVLV